MKNKDKYDLRLLTVRPKYMVSGCGKKLTDNFMFDIYIGNDRVATDIKAKHNSFSYLMEWLEQE